MRAILLSLSFMFSVSAFAGYSVTILKGYEALAEIGNLQRLARKGADIQSYRNILQRGYGEDAVIETIDNISGIVDGKKYVCTSSTFEMNELSEYDSAPSDTAVCYIN